MTSLRARVRWLWGVLAGVCGALLFVLVSAERAGPAALVGRASAAAVASCETLRSAVDRLVPESDTGTSALMSIVVDLSLRDADGMEGGVWDKTHGFGAYAFPTYEGRSAKTDVPSAEKASIEVLAAQVDSAHRRRSEVRRGEREAVVLAVCALPRQQVGWTLTRVATAQARALQRAVAAAGAALAVVLPFGAWLLVGLRGWSRQLARLEGRLAARAGESTRIDACGEPDLDRLVVAFNTSAERIEALNADSERLGRALAQADRLAALGRVAAGLAHEIRNPLGSMRLRAENALAVTGEAALERRTGALGAVVKAVDRIDALVASLLALTRPLQPVRAPVDLAAWVQEAVALRAEQAERQGVSLAAQCPPGLQAAIDAAALGQALDNLLLNALQHTPAGGRIEVRIDVPGRSTDDPPAGAQARSTDGSPSAHWRLRVDDTGPGVVEAMRPQLFEPFATGRANGTGLGLATAHEIVSGHGGTLVCGRSPAGGARFEMELPWHVS